MWLSIGETANEVQRSYSYVYRLVLSGRVRSKRTGRGCRHKYLVSLASVRTYMAKKCC